MSHDYSSSSPRETVFITSSDHLGSPRINTDENGKVIARHDFQPFGEEIQRPSYGSDDVRRKFTSYERENETDLDFAQARMYASKLGRFTTTDPILIKQKRLPDPQTINLYVFTRNNPLLFIDPNGEDIFLANRSKEGRRKALLSITGSLKTNDEKKNIGVQKNKEGKYELFVKDWAKVEVSKASAQYLQLLDRIGSSTEIDFTLVEKGSKVKTKDGSEWSQAALSSDAGGVTLGYSDGSVEVVVAEGGVTNGVKGLTKSGKDVQIEFSEHMVTAHELLGETVKYTNGYQHLQNDPEKDSRVVIYMENLFRKELGLPLRSGKDHGQIQEVVTVH